MLPVRACLGPRQLWTHVAAKSHMCSVQARQQQFVPGLAPWACRPKIRCKMPEPTLAYAALAFDPTILSQPPKLFVRRRSHRRQRRQQEIESVCFLLALPAHTSHDMVAPGAGDLRMGKWNCKICKLQGPVGHSVFKSQWQQACRPARKQNRRW